MAKSKKSSSFSEPARKTQKTQKSIVKKTPSPKVFKVISEVRSNVDLDFFKGLTQLFPARENFSYALPHESDSSEQIEENPSDRASGSDVAAITGDEKEDDEVEKDEGGYEDVGQREGKGVVVAEEEAEAEEEEDDESDEAERLMIKKYHLGVLSRRRLTIPHSKMVARYADILLRSSSRGARRYLSSLPPSYELALVMRNLAENDRLNEELTYENARLTELAHAGM
ncbi:hypothetical protein Dimus_033439 [Dionaea muscipula]